ncbi:MAG: insulinase family protein, partial [Proteobacteria bacterium]|nr:insulinase family protein [Pseudomonadota bacterium]
MSSIRKSTLDNGISVITEKMSDVESASLGIWVKTGSRHETPRINGISHFIEHMLFKGTPSRNALEIAKEIESVGGVLNAFTGREYTCFYSKVLSDNLPIAIDLLSDIFLNSLFDAEELKKEKKVVLQEIKMVEDTPDDLVHDLFSETFWKDQPMGRPILGLRSTLKSLTRR